MIELTLNRQTDKQTDRRTDKQKYTTERKTDGQTDRQTDRQTDTNLRRNVVVCLVEVDVALPGLNVPALVNVLDRGVTAKPRQRPRSGGLFLLHRGDVRGSDN